MSEYTVESFYKGLAEEKLKGSRCVTCGRLMIPPRPICISCGSTELEPHFFIDSGAIAASTVIYVPLTRFQAKCPHSVGVIRLEEGESISGLILSEGKHLAPGTKVKAKYLKEEGRVTLAFQPV